MDIWWWSGVEALHIFAPFLYFSHLISLISSQGAALCAAGPDLATGPGGGRRPPPRGPGAAGPAGPAGPAVDAR